METHKKDSRLCYFPCTFCFNIQLQCEICHCTLLSNGYFTKDAKINNKSNFCLECYDKYVVTVPLSTLKNIK